MLVVTAVTDIVWVDVNDLEVELEDVSILNLELSIIKQYFYNSLRNNLIL